MIWCRMTSSHRGRVTGPGKAFYQREASVSLDERHDPEVIGSDNEIALPMPRDSTIGNGSGPVCDPRPR